MITHRMAGPSEWDKPTGIRRDAIDKQTSLYQALPACHGKNHQRLRDVDGGFHRMCFQRTVRGCSTNRESVADLGETVSPCFFVLPFQIVLNLQAFIHGSLRGPFPLCSPKGRLHKCILRRWPALRFILAAALHRVFQPSKRIPSRFIDVGFWLCFFIYSFTVYAVIH